MSEPRRADICVVACAEAFRGDGEILVSPFGTVPALGARLARRTFEPDLVLTDGEAALMADTPALSVPADQVVREAWLPYRRVFDVVWSGRRHVMMMASQLDHHGNQNLSCIGDWHQPRSQLIGCRGAPGNTVNHATSYWVPAHGPRVFVEAVDMVCGVGNDRAGAAPAAAKFHELRVVVSDLAVLDFATPERVLRLRSVHPGTTAAEVRQQTGCPLVVPEEVPETRLPTPEELEVIAALDPEGLRYREVAG